MSTKKYLVLSVEHSGTRFVKNHLLRGHERSYYHLRPHYQDFLRTVVEKYQFVFVPLRHPLEIARSWSKRGMSLEMLAERFDCLSEFFDSYDPLWIPVDSPIRDHFVEIARCRVGIDLDPGKWPLVGHEVAKADHRMTADELELIAPSIKRNQKFFERFYANAMEVSDGTFDRQCSAA
jgi:hypothetical protein